MMDEDYKLSSEFSGHDGDARAIAAVSRAGGDSGENEEFWASLVSGSRDRMLKGWSAEESFAYWRKNGRFMTTHTG